MTSSRSHQTKWGPSAMRQCLSARRSMYSLKTWERRLIFLHSRRIKSKLFRWGLRRKPLLMQWSSRERVWSLISLLPQAMMRMRRRHSRQGRCLLTALLMRMWLRLARVLKIPLSFELTSLSSLKLNCKPYSVEEEPPSPSSSRTCTMKRNQWTNLRSPIKWVTSQELLSSRTTSMKNCQNN